MMMSQAAGQLRKKINQPDTHETTPEEQSAVSTDTEELPVDKERKGIQVVHFRNTPTNLAVSFPICLR